VVANTLVYFIGSALIGYDPEFIVPTVPGSTSAQIAILVLMHVAAACVIVGMLTMADG